MERIDKSILTQAQQLRNEGITVEKIAEILGISRSSVSRNTIPADGIIKTRNYTPKDPTRSNSTVTLYKPDYRRSITPATISTEYTYGGIPFKVNYVEQSIELDTSQVKIDDLYCISDIEDLKQLGEALVGIAFFFEEKVKNI